MRRSLIAWTARDDAAVGGRAESSNSRRPRRLTAGRIASPPIKLYGSHRTPREV